MSSEMRRITEMSVYEFGPFRFDADQCVLWRVNHDRLKIKGKGFVTEAELGKPLCLLLLAFLKAVVEHGSHDAVLSEEDLIKAAWPNPNPLPDIARATLTRTLSKLKMIFKYNDPRPHDYITHVANGYKFMFDVKEVSGSAEPNPKAKEHYEWGRYFLNKFTTEDGLRKAIGHFQDACVEAPNYAAAFAHESLSHQWLSIYSWRAPEVTLPDALRASAEAVRFGNTLGVAYAARALAVLFGGPERGADRWKKFERLIDKAVELDRRREQNFETVYQIDALRYAARGEFGESHLAVKKSLDIRPVSITSNVLKPLILFVSRDYHSCDAVLQEIISQDEDIDAAYYVRVLVCIYKGEPDRALEEIKKGASRAEGNVLYRLLLAYWLVLWGPRDEAVKLLTELDEESKHRYISPYHRALPYVHIDADEAIERLHGAASEKDPWVLLLRVDPRLDLLRRRERFKELLRSLGLDFN